MSIYPDTFVADEVVQHAIEQEFECHRCGNCCKGEGVVKIGRVEADRMAKHLGLSRRVFLERYAQRVSPNTWWLIDRDNEERWCIFLTRDAEGRYGCMVNAAKPNQCAAFPAKWRNSDSFKTCPGLRALMARLEARRGDSEP